MVKPYSTSELIARIKAELECTCAAASGEQLTSGDIRLDAKTHKVYRADNEVSLGLMEFRLPSTLMEKPRRMWTHEQLLDRVWGHDIYLEICPVDVHIGCLRKSLCQYSRQDVKCTARGAGYASCSMSKCKAIHSVLRPF